jgi:hypothetical protein
MPPPSFITCELCHQKFGKHSIAIHMKSCVAKREASTAFCPVCDNLVSNDEYEKHVAECKTVNAEMYKKKKAAEAASKKGAGKVEAAAGAGDGVKAAAGPRSKVPEHVLRRMKEMAETPEQRVLRKVGLPCDACGTAIANVACMGCHVAYCESCSAGIHEANKALADHVPTVRNDLAAANAAEAAAASARAGAGGAETDGRSECAICNRKFASDRIAKHQLICTKVRGGGRWLQDPCARLHWAEGWRNCGCGCAPGHSAADGAALRRTAAHRSSVFARCDCTARSPSGGGAAAAFDRTPAAALPLLSISPRRWLTLPLLLFWSLPLQIAGKKSKKPGLTAKQARLKGTDFEAFEKLKEAEAKAAAKRGGKAGKAGAAATAGAAGGEEEIKAPSRWRQEHEAFQAIATAGKVEGGAGSAPASPVKAAPLPPAAADATGAAAAAADGSAAAPLDASMAAAAVGPKKPKLGHIGDKIVVIDRGLVGVLQFRGPIWGLKKGTWIGVEFHDAPHGRNDGSFEVRAAVMGRCDARCLLRAAVAGALRPHFSGPHICDQCGDEADTI